MAEHVRADREAEAGRPVEARHYLAEATGRERGPALRGEYERCAGLRFALQNRSGQARRIGFTNGVHLSLDQWLSDRARSREGLSLILASFRKIERTRTTATFRFCAQIRVAG